MAAIDNYLETLRTAVYGEEVRSAIISAIQQCYTDAAAGVIPQVSFTELDSGTRVTITVGTVSQSFGREGSESK